MFNYKLLLLFALAFNVGVHTTFFALNRGWTIVHFSFAAISAVTYLVMASSLKNTGD